MNTTKRFFSVFTTILSLVYLSVSVFAYNDINEITDHVNLKVPEKLSIGRPAGEGFTSANTYFIMGSSNPSQPLSVNGQVINTRGERGSFGVFVQLNNDGNLFRFEQNGQSAQVTIRKGSATQVTRINTIRDMAPSYDCATLTGETVTLSCIAPSGAKVSATVNGRTIPLQQSAQASNGVPADFRGTTIAEEVTGTKDLGKVTYTMSYNNKTTSYQSDGRVFITGSGSTLTVQIKNNASCVYEDENMGYFQSVARMGAVDAVTQIGKKCYQLSSGGWIPKESVTPLTGNVAIRNKVSKTVFETTTKGETLKLTGTTHPMFTVSRDSEKLTIKLMQTYGVDTPDVEESKLLSTVRVFEEDGNTTLTFALQGKKKLWGYDVSYKNGVTTIYLKYKPTLSTGDTPLTGVTVAVDAGHGGTDPGALGFPMSGGATEAQINMATATAVQKRLEKLGANVIMTRKEEIDITMNDRMTMARKEDADFFVSLHSNSAGYEVDGNKTTGTEVYYYFNNSNSLATIIASKLSEYTGRTARGAKMSNYRVTLNSFCPSVLVEMGFMTNPIEYDDLTTPKGIFKVANAIGDSIVETLS